MDGIAVMTYPIGPGPVPANFAVVTKSGTNDYHGTAFWHYNSSALNARDFFSPAAPFRVYHNFGTSFGGPIRKDKTFFFGDYEGSREAANVVITGNTPLPAWRSGDFTVCPQTLSIP